MLIHFMCSVIAFVSFHGYSEGGGSGELCLVFLLFLLPLLVLVLLLIVILSYSGTYSAGLLPSRLPLLARKFEAITGQRCPLMLCAARALQ